MSRYGNGVSFSDASAMDRERLIHALNGELVTGETDDGKFTYGKASKDECDEFILSCYDNAVYHAKTGMHSGRAFEYILKRHKTPYDLSDYNQALDKTRMKGDVD